MTCLWIHCLVIETIALPSHTCHAQLAISECRGWNSKFIPNSTLMLLGEIWEEHSKFQPINVTGTPGSQMRKNIDFIDI